MTQPIQREGSWWSKTDDGWMRWNEEAQSWEGQTAGPPPPRPPNGSPVPSATVPVVASSAVEPTATQPATAAQALTGIPPAQKKSGGKTVAAVAAVVVIAAAAVGGYWLLKDDGEDAASGAGGQTTQSDGSDSGDTGDQTGGVTKAEFVAAADALCTEASGEFSQLTEPATPEEAGPFLIEAIAINEALYADLSALEPPADDNGEAAAAIGGLKALVEQMKTLLGAIEAQDSEAIQANYDQLGVATDEANSAAAAYGLVACAS